jgi:hypothetical protein
MEFDRLVCALGLTEFCLPLFASERLDGPGDGVLVHEIRPGVRLRGVYLLGRASA